MSKDLYRLNRRSLLRAAAATVLPWRAARAKTEEFPVKIDRIDLFPVRYPTSGYFKFFVGPRGAVGRAAVIIKITADNGVVGWGQSVPVGRWSYETLSTSTLALQDYYLPALIGRDATDIAGAHRAMDGALAASFTTGMPITRAGIDVGLHDLLGKLTGKSLAQLWDRPRGGPLTLSWTLNPRELGEVESLMEAGRKLGYRHFNIKVAPNPEFDVQLARLVRHLAPDGFLWADANGGYAPDTALKVAPQLADAGVDALEAPVKPNQIAAYQALKKQAALPIYMDEGVVSPVELQEFMRLGMLDGVAMKHSRCGGLLSARRQIELLTDAGLRWLGSGLADPDISLAATLCLFGAYGLDKPAAVNGPQFLTADVLAKPLRIANGAAEVPEGPGLGIEVDEGKVHELVRQSTG